MLLWLVAHLYCKFYYLFVQYVVPVNCFKKYMFHDFLCIIWTTSKTEKETWQHSQWSFEIKKKDFPETLQEQILLKCINDFSVFHFPGFKEQKSHRWIIFSNHFWTSQSECAKNTIQLWCLQSIPIATAWLYYYDHCSDRCVGLFSRSPERTLLALSVILAGNFTSSC